MTNGLGSGFAGVMLYAVLSTIAGLLVVNTGITLYGRHRSVPVPVQYVAVVLVGAVVGVAGFATVALADEASLLAALFGATVGLPLVLVAGRARSTGATWVTVAATSGMAWGLPFLVSVGVLFVLTASTDLSAPVLTGLAGVLTTGSALPIGGYVGSVLRADLGQS